MPSRTWVKIYCDKWLSGTIREETATVRGVFVDLIALAGSGRYGDIGQIKLANNIGMTDEQLSLIIGIPLKDWHLIKQRLIETSRISTNGDNIVTIVNWKKYQSEYERQRSYRDKLQREVTTTSNKRPLQSEVTPNSYGEKRREEKRIENPLEGSNTSKVTKNISSITKTESMSLKQKMGEFVNVLLTTGEYVKLTVKFGEVDTKERIERLSAYKKSKGVNYKDDYATILNWARRDKEKNGISQTNPRPVLKPEEYTRPEA